MKENTTRRITANKNNLFDQKTVLNIIKMWTNNIINDHELLCHKEHFKFFTNEKSFMSTSQFEKFLNNNLENDIIDKVMDQIVFYSLDIENDVDLTSIYQDIANYLLYYSSNIDPNKLNEKINDTITDYGYPKTDKAFYVFFITMAPLINEKTPDYISAKYLDFLYISLLSSLILNNKFYSNIKNYFNLYEDVMLDKNFEYQHKLSIMSRIIHNRCNHAIYLAQKN